MLEILLMDVLIMDVLIMDVMQPISLVLEFERCVHKYQIDKVF